MKPLFSILGFLVLSATSLAISDGCAAASPGQTTSGQVVAAQPNAVSPMVCANQPTRQAVDSCLASLAYWQQHPDQIPLPKHDDDGLVKYTETDNGRSFHVQTGTKVDVWLNEQFFSDLHWYYDQTTTDPVNFFQEHNIANLENGRSEYQFMATGHGKVTVVFKLEHEFGGTWRAVNDPKCQLWHYQRHHVCALPPLPVKTIRITFTVD